MRLTPFPAVVVGLVLATPAAAVDRYIPMKVPPSHRSRATSSGAYRARRCGSSIGASRPSRTQPFSRSAIPTPRSTSPGLQVPVREGGGRQVRGRVGPEGPAQRPALCDYARREGRAPGRAGWALGRRLHRRYAAWDFAGRAGWRDLDGLVLIDARGARKLARLTPIEKPVVVDDRRTSHLDPLSAAPKRNSFLKSVVPFLKRISRGPAS